MNVMECAQAILDVLAEDYPVELEELSRWDPGWSLSVALGTDGVVLRVEGGRVALSPIGTDRADIEVDVERELLFDVLDGTQRMEDAVRSDRLEVSGDQELILSLSEVVEDFLGLCHRSARIVGIVNEFRYGHQEPIS